MTATIKALGLELDRPLCACKPFRFVLNFNLDDASATLTLTCTDCHKHTSAILDVLPIKIGLPESFLVRERTP